MIAPLTGAPAAVCTETTSGAAKGLLMVALCGVPLVAVMLAGGAAAALVSEKVAEESTPGTVAVAVKGPTVALAVSTAEVATPLAPVVAVLTPPAKVPPGPVTGAVKVTTTPGTGAPVTSVTVTASGAVKAVFTVALCGVPPVATMLAAASVPVPWSMNTVLGFALSLVVSVSVAVTLPVRTGINVTLIAQVCPGATCCPGQLLLAVKFVKSLNTTLSMTRELSPVFPSVMDCGVLEVPTA